MRSTRNKLNAVPEITVKKIFFRNVDYFKIEGEGEFQVNGNSPDIHISDHLSGLKDIQLNPLSLSGLSSWIVLDFVLSEKQKHPFSNASLIANELKKKGIPSHIEVTDGGKGYYRLWIFFDSPVDGLDAANAFKKFASDIIGLEMGLHPDKMSDDFVPMPFHGESVLFQRRVFVNSVGKMIKDQSGYLLNLDYCSYEIASAFIDEFNILSEPDLPEIIDKFNILLEPDLQEILNENKTNGNLTVNKSNQKKSQEKDYQSKESSEIKKKTDSNQLSFDISLPVVYEETEPEEETDRISAGLIDVIPQKVDDVNNGANKKIEISPLETVNNVKKDFLIFNSGNGLSAVDTYHIEEILDRFLITPYPSKSEILGGVINHENNIIPIIPKDPGVSVSGNNKVIILRSETGKYGMEAFEVKGVFSGSKSKNGILITEKNNFNEKTIQVPDLEKIPLKYFLTKYNGGSADSKKPFVFEFSGFLFGIDINFVCEIISYSGNFLNSKISYNNEKIPLLKPSENYNQIPYPGKANSLIEKRVLILGRDGIHTGIHADSILGLKSVCPETGYRVTDYIRMNSLIKSFFQLRDSEKIIFILNSDSIFERN